MREPTSPLIGTAPHGSPIADASTRKTGNAYSEAVAVALYRAARAACDFLAVFPRAVDQAALGFDVTASLRDQCDALSCDDLTSSPANADESALVAALDGLKSAASKSRAPRGVVAQTARRPRRRFPASARRRVVPLRLVAPTRKISTSSQKKKKTYPLRAARNARRRRRLKNSPVTRGKRNEQKRSVRKGTRARVVTRRTRFARPLGDVGTATSAPRTTINPRRPRRDACARARRRRDAMRTPAGARGERGNFRRGRARRRRRRTREGRTARGDGTGAR